ncbi:putative mitochondrial carrier protein [Aspergillus saccharolyticus JOP 1030-1]|uniref:Mitochondrial carrier n=1 Tax=Aspergillus saccharolyticus JOP 1030-1 TaxID=1450539 RepID=A0A318ZF79_9EURO|nr:mitochondrial carrier [Aspergillus saccharolyticus JOP 1030-1]PYH46196.1 mitochondrial carrier [Aspergillus saccharolyticus JOP 1030-1]
MPNTNSDIWLSGAFAVFITDFLVYPFDTLKTRIQSPNYATVYKDATTGHVKRGLLFKGLYQGVGSVVLATIPASGAFFTTYESTKRTLTHLLARSPNPKATPGETGTETTTTTTLLPTPVVHSLASCTAEAVSCFILTPAEVLKQNAQMYSNTSADHTGGSSASSSTSSHSHPKKAGSSSSSKPGNITIHILRKFRHRPWKLWSGYSALVGRNLPFTGIQFPIFEFVKRRIAERRAEGKDSRKGMNGEGEGGADTDSVLERVYVTGIAGSVAGTISSVVTTPIDVVKTRMMLAAGEAETQKKRPGAWAVGKEVFRREGVPGLFRGGALRAFWTAISFGIYLSMYEGGKVYLGNRRMEKDQKAGDGAPL